VTPNFNPWPNSENILSFTPLPSLSSIIHQVSTLSKSWRTLPSSLFHLSQLPWSCKDSTKGKTQGWKQKDLLKPLLTFPFECFGFNSSSSLQRYSNLHFARSPYMVQSFEFALVEHLLRSPRRHTYRSIRFRWTHCENPRFGIGRPSSA
jgi:hypothetical protein